MDLQTAVWHPCSKNDTPEAVPLAVNTAQGCYLQTQDGRHVLDAIASWWCKPLGHGHPALRQALIAQAEQLEHTLLGDVTHPQIEKLSAQLIALAPHMAKAFYASDGACATEIAMKMSLQARHASGQKHRKRFISLKNSYHGETCGALSVSELKNFRQPFDDILMPCDFINPVPYVNDRRDPVWSNADWQWRVVESKLNALADHATAIIVEPIVQGAGGMKIYSADFLKRLCAWAQANDIHLIADEIMTGLGRTGRWLASDYADITPDFICLGKSVTGGWLPMSVVLTTESMYQHAQRFIHSHTFSGNALAAAVANATMKQMQQIDICQHAQDLETKLRTAMQAVADQTGRLDNVRVIGGIAAAEISGDVSALAEQALAQDILLRPLGNTLYWFPPLTIRDSDIEQLQTRTLAALQM